MPPVGFEPAIAVSERPQTHAVDLAGTSDQPVVYISNFMSINTRNVQTNDGVTQT